MFIMLSGPVKLRANTSSNITKKHDLAKVRRRVDCKMVFK